MILEIFSPESGKKMDQVQSVVLPGSLGQAQILPGHAEAFFSLKAGNIVVETQKDTQEIPISGGICYIENDNISVVL